MEPVREDSHQVSGYLVDNLAGMAVNKAMMQLRDAASANAKDAKQIMSEHSGEVRHTASPTLD